jgi:hypothetical protein
VSWLRDLGGRGPDAFLALDFGLPAAGPGLREVAREHGMAGFEHHTLPDSRVRNAGMPGSPGAGDVEVFFDRAHAAALLGNLTGDAPTNVWVYAVVVVGDDFAWFEHGYAHDDSRWLESEAELIDALAKAGPELRSWSVTYGGQGYEGGVVESGRDAESLRAYLGRRETRPAER